MKALSLILTILGVILSPTPLSAEGIHVGVDSGPYPYPTELPPPPNLPPPPISPDILLNELAAPKAAPTDRSTHMTIQTFLRGRKNYIDSLVSAIGAYQPALARIHSERRLKDLNFQRMELEKFQRSYPLALISEAGTIAVQDFHRTAKELEDRIKTHSDTLLQLKLDANFPRDDMTIGELKGLKRIIKTEKERLQTLQQELAELSPPSLLRAEQIAIDVNALLNGGQMASAFVTIDGTISERIAGIEGFLKTLEPPNNRFLNDSPRPFEGIFPRK